MALALPRLRTKLASDAAYFTKVYNHTFEFARGEGQRSIAGERRSWGPGDGAGALPAVVGTGTESAQIVRAAPYLCVGGGGVDARAVGGVGARSVHCIHLALGVGAKSHGIEFGAAEDRLRRVAIDTAQAFWALLLPHGMSGGAISHTDADTGTGMDGGGDVRMGGTGKHTAGFAPEHVDWWFEFLGTHGGKGVSKDTWVMFLDFVRTVDARFETYDMEAAWPSTIDDFVEWAKVRVAGGS
ncbi:Cullin binding-domain-containing protein [Mycena alexandri]|uniref:Defective in cullin neddylation protein n=1 Tax=Mycena alexandri TaxID=1745969 RepID=A0AAD6T6W9_9AGAR|nr:Cullin binding-domain-containing protein [Mycena alexandri]